MKLEVRNLKKTYGTVQALKGINYTFTPGVYGILGANGAGKSTMINLITDNVSRDKMNGGSILFGEDSAEEDILKLGKQFRGLVGYMPQQQGFYEDFSPKAFLKYMAEIKGVKRIKTTDDNGNEVVKTVNQQIDELLEVVNLTKVAYKKIGGFSGGMKQRVLLAQALLGNPKILILDEPTAGLDPKERISIRNYIAELSKDKIILFATHVVSDIECIADKVLLLKSGEIIATGTPVELIESMAGKVGEITCTLDEVGELQKEYKNIMELIKGRPADETGRLEKEIRVYDLLDKLGMEYYRTDHEPATTMEVCNDIDKILDTLICKNLFLCNRQKTNFYMLMMPGDKPFKTKDLSKQINSARLSFADESYMEEFLDITPGSVSIMGLMNDTDNHVQLLMDKEVLEGESLGCHPCINTSSLKLKTKEVMEKFLPAVHHEAVIVELPRYEEQE